MSRDSGFERKTFVVDFLETKNNTWQGTLFWAQTQKKVSFRSAIELLRLLDLALGNERRDWDCAKQIPDDN